MMPAVIVLGFFGSLMSGAIDLVTAPAMLPVLIGAGIKHLDKVPLVGKLTERIPNQAIPYINLGLSAVMPQFGIAQAVAATGWHQIGKRALRAGFDVMLRRSAPGSRAEMVAKAVGPGTRLSL